MAANGPSFEALVEVWTPALMRLAWRFTREGEEARDLVQAALADAWERREALRNPEVAGLWLRRILVNRAINLHRRRRLWGAVLGFLGRGDDGQELEPPASDTPADVALDRARRMRTVERAVAALPARQAAAITLRYFDGLPLAQVADAMGIDVGTTRVHLYRALKKLKALGAGVEEVP